MTQQPELFRILTRQHREVDAMLSQLATEEFEGERLSDEAILRLTSDVSISATLTATSSRSRVASALQGPPHDLLPSRTKDSSRAKTRLKPAINKREIQTGT